MITATALLVHGTVHVQVQIVRDVQMNRSNFISTYKIRCADCGHGKGICNCTGASFKFKVPPGNIVSPDFSVMPNVVISPGAAVTYNGLTIGTVIATNGQTATVRLEGAQGIFELARPTEVSMGVAAPPPEIRNDDLQRLRYLDWS